MREAIFFEVEISLCKHHFYCKMFLGFWCAGAIRSSTELPTQCHVQDMKEGMQNMHDNYVTVRLTAALRPIPRINYPIGHSQQRQFQRVGGRLAWPDAT